MLNGMSMCKSVYMLTCHPLHNSIKNTKSELFSLKYGVNYHQVVWKRLSFFRENSSRLSLSVSFISPSPCVKVCVLAASLIRHQ